MKGVLNIYARRLFLKYSGIVSVRNFSKEIDRFDNLTRSKHVKLKYINVQKSDGTVQKISSALVDNTTEYIGDQFTRFHLKITNTYGYALEDFAERAQKRLIARNKKRQTIAVETIQHLGLDLAVAHVICGIGGRVQFVGIDHWFQRYNNHSADLPTSYAGNLKLESIDASGTPIVYEGFEHLPELTELRHLRLRRCMHVDDHCLSLVGLITNSPLEMLDVSECPRVTANGITTLTQLKNLRRLLISGNPNLEDKELVCLLLEDFLPKVYIDGVDYLGKLPEAQRNKVLAIEATPIKGLLTQNSTTDDFDLDEELEDKVN